MQVLIVHFSPLIEWRRRDEAICSWHQGGSAQATVAKVECRDRRERVWRRSSRCLRNQTWAGRQGRWRSGVAAPMRACDVYGGHVLWQNFVAQGHVIYAPSIRKGWRQVGGQARVQLERWRTWSLVRGIDMLACCDGGQPSLERADTVCQISVFSITDQFVSAGGLNDAFLCLYIPATAFSPLFLSGTSHSEPGTRGTRLVPITSNFPPSTSVASNNRRLSPLPRDGRIILHRITNRRSPL